MKQLAAESDAGIFNGSNGAVYAMLMAGKPGCSVSRALLALRLFAP